MIFKVGAIALALFVLQKLSISGVGCANILFLAGIHSHSHHIWNREISNALAVRGHNITVISPRRDINPPANVHYLEIIGNYEVLYNTLFTSLAEYEQRSSPWLDVIDFHSFCAKTSAGKTYIATALNIPYSQ